MALRSSWGRIVRVEQPTRTKARQTTTVWQVIQTTVGGFDAARDGEPAGAADAVCWDWGAAEPERHDEAVGERAGDVGELDGDPAGCLTRRHPRCTMQFPVPGAAA